jgi:hypothetical protein
MHCGQCRLPYADVAATPPSCRLYPCAAAERHVMLMDPILVSAWEKERHGGTAREGPIGWTRLAVRSAQPTAAPLSFVFPESPWLIPAPHLRPQTTGSTAVKAIQTLLSRGVFEDRILFLTIIAAPEGIRKVGGLSSARCPRRRPLRGTQRVSLAASCRSAPPSRASSC